MHALDLRGHGRSARTPGGYCLDDARPTAAGGRRTDRRGGPFRWAPSLPPRWPRTATRWSPRCSSRTRRSTSSNRTYSPTPAWLGASACCASPSSSWKRTERRSRRTRTCSPHPAGDRLGDHLHDDALWSRAGSLAQTDPEAITAGLDGTTFGTYDPDRPLHCPGGRTRGPGIRRGLRTRPRHLDHLPASDRGSPGRWSRNRPDRPRPISQCECGPHASWLRAQPQSREENRR
jgi:hypothetical protein